MSNPHYQHDMMHCHQEQCLKKYSTSEEPDVELVKSIIDYTCEQLQNKKGKEE